MAGTGAGVAVGGAGRLAEPAPGMTALNPQDRLRTVRGLLGRALSTAPHSRHMMTAVTVVLSHAALVSLSQQGVRGDTYPTCGHHGPVSHKSFSRDRRQVRGDGLGLGFS